jgi:hypothetical protein
MEVAYPGVAKGVDEHSNFAVCMIYHKGLHTYCIHLRIGFKAEGHGKDVSRSLDVPNGFIDPA